MHDLCRTAGVINHFSWARCAVAVNLLRLDSDTPSYVALAYRGVTDFVSNSTGVVRYSFHFEVNSAVVHDDQQVHDDQHPQYVFGADRPQHLRPDGDLSELDGHGQSVRIQRPDLLRFDSREHSRVKILLRS